MAAQAPTTMDLWLEEPSARSPGSEELHFQQLTKQSLLLLVKFYDPASQTLRVRVFADNQAAVLSVTILSCFDLAFLTCCNLRYHTCQF